MSESEALTQTEESIQAAEAETKPSNQTEESSQTEETETEPVNLAKEVQNEFFKVVYDSFSEDLEVYNLEIFGDVPVSNE